MYVHDFLNPIICVHGSKKNGVTKAHKDGFGDVIPPYFLVIYSCDNWNFFKSKICPRQSQLKF